jgi:hypothetical protein
MDEFTDDAEEKIRDFKKSEELRERTIQKIKELKCSWCEKPIMNNEHDEYIFWQCRACGALFCYDCSHVKGDVFSKDAVKCKCRGKDCIWERKVLKPKEVKNG